MKKIATLLLMVLCCTWTSGQNSNIRSQVKKMQQASVVESKKLPNGLTVNVRETADGFRFKQVETPENCEYVAPQPRRIENNKHETPLFVESWEDWDGQDKTWLPDGWSRRETSFAGTTHTWFVNSQSGIYVPAPVDGNYYMEIIYSSTQTQNEWLDSPAITPREGDSFSCYFIGQPFTLFDITKYDSKLKDFTERINTWNFRVYMSVDGGSWTEIYNFYENFKDADAYEMRMEQSYLGPRTIHVTQDLSEYVGHQVVFRFRYTGDDGDSMFLDLIEVGKPYLTASYTEPGRTCNFGMTQDYKQPVNWAYYPDGVSLKWTNQSCEDATDFLWTYNDPATGELTTSTEKDLTLQYEYKTEDINNITNVNVYESPVLRANREGYQSGEFRSETDRFKVGGRTYVNVDGQVYHCGAATYRQEQGMTMLTTGDGFPVCGHREGEDNDFWYDMNGVSREDYDIHVIGFYNSFSTPKKPYKVRGLWVHGIGQIERGAKLTATIHVLDEDGVIQETPIATASLRYDSIQTYGSTLAQTGLDYHYLTLPFVFADPAEIDQYVMVRINNIDEEHVTYFSPLQTLIPDADGSCHGYLRLTAQNNSTGSTNTGLLPLSYITSQYGACYGSFYITLDMAYDDCPDWGHIEDAEEDASLLELSNGHLQYYVPQEGGSLYDRTTKAAFYDRTTAGTTILYVCVGALEQGDSPALTNHIRIEMPNSLLGQELVISDDPTVLVSLYNCLTSTYTTANDGKLTVTQTASGYDVYCDVVDKNSGTYFGTIYQDLPWMNITDEKVVPNELRVYYIADENHSDTEDLEVYDIKSAYVNDLDANQYIIYLATQEGVTSEEQMKNLEGEPAAIVCAPAEYLSDRVWGYSGLYNDHYEASLKVSITFRGVEYTPENVFGVTQSGTDDPKALGANFKGTLNDGKLKDFEFFISASPSLNGRCVKAHYTGAAGTTTGLQTICVASEKYPRYNLNGQRVDNQYQGITIVNGKKYIR